MKTRYILPLFFLTILSNTVSATEIFHKTKIDMIYPFKDGSVYVGIDTENSSCTNGNKFYRVEVGRANVTDETIDRIFSTLLAAAAQQNQVEIIFEPNSNGHCYISRLKVFY